MIPRLLIDYFRRLNQLQKIIFSCYIKRDYAENSFLQAKKIHRLRMKLFFIMQKIRQKNRYSELLDNLTRLYEIIFSLNILKLRVADHATFEVCQREFEKMTLCLDVILSQAAKGKISSVVLTDLSGAIESFSNVYQATLRIVAAEPEAFLFFIQDLSDFRDQLEIFSFSLSADKKHQVEKKHFLGKLWLRRLLSVLIASSIAVIAGHLFALGSPWLVPLVALFVMQTSIGNAFSQGIFRLLVVVLIAAVASLFIQSAEFFYQVVHDAGIGALIGIVVNIAVLPTRADMAFRVAMISLMKTYQAYFTNMMNMLLQKKKLLNENAFIEAELLSLPGWVYDVGFDSGLQKGYRFFLTHMEQVSDVLFSMHHLINFFADIDMPKEMREPFLRCSSQIESFFSAFLAVLELKKIPSAVDDFSTDLDELEKQFQLMVPLSLELLDINPDYVYLAALISDLKELRKLLLKVGQALRF